jgi:nucleoside-diphosphate-sugar epimerase
MSVLICLGLGYCAQHYVAGFGARFTRVVGTSRVARMERSVIRDGDPALRSAPCGLRSEDVEMLVFDGSTASPALLAAIAQADALLISAAPDENGDPVLGALGETLAAAPRLGAVVLLSTIGVYGDRGGGWVDETAKLDPANERAQPRLAAERAWQALGKQRGFAVAVLRLGGIYGPGQNALVNVRLGRARNIDKPGQVFNRIHVADIAQAIDAAFAHKADGVFNVVDDAPSPPGDPIAYAAELLGMAAPPVIAFADAVPTMSPMAASFYAENRRVRNDRLKRELGVQLRYPSYREGLRALLTEGN